MSVMKYMDGVQNTDSNQQAIAFWTHVIDIFAGIAENDYTLVPTGALTEDDISDKTYNDTATNTCAAFMGAAREGFKNSIANLHEDIRVPVESYMKIRLSHSRYYSADFMLGTENPYDDEDY